MIFTETKLRGAYLLDLEKREDSRGFFARAWDQKEFEDHGLNPTVVQCNLSFNKKGGTTRGMHYQAAPYEEAKLVRCTRGSIFDAIVDLRPDSVTFMQWVGFELTSENRRMLYVPEGFAHGYQTLEDDTETFYQVSEWYKPEAERGIRWDDPAMGIAWPDTESREISDNDMSWPAFENAAGAR